MPADRRVYRVNPTTLFKAMRAQVIWGLCPIEERSEPPKIHVCPGLRVSPEQLWNRFDEKLKMKALGRTVYVEVPDPADLVEALQENERESLVHAFQSIIEAKNPNPEKKVNWQDAITFFETASSEKQLEAVLRLREFIAYDMVAFALLRVNLDWLDSVFKEHPWTTESEHQAYRQELLTFLEHFQTVDLPASSELFKLYYWEERINLPDSVRRLLPPGFWPQALREETRAFELGEREVLHNDRRIDPARLAFYVDELGCRKVLETKGWFHDRNYVAFLLRTASGDRVAILDCAEVGNAAYLFYIGRQVEDRDRWTKDAVRSKWELLQTGGPCGTFVRRFIHSAHWRQQVRQYLASH